ncbi:LysR family transcriptional regulator [Yoonia sp. 2307UL14-13]|uniref:LysR family transcriptional regulator n=1 Tax=Yoonia sp. 2307UL14-13 TaxID=3126506 RepID=UPI0030AD9A8F
MQDHDWNALKSLLALARAGTLTGAARALGVSDTTVARQVKALESDLGIVLFARDQAGRYRVTSEGAEVLAQAEAVARANAEIEALAGRKGAHLAGVVRVSSVPVLINRMLVPRLPKFWETYPEVQVELAPEARNLDLTRREADLAIRFARPVAGGLRVRARKLGALAFGVFGPASTAPDLPWIAYDDAHDSLPQARWLQRQQGAVSKLRVADVETALEAVAAGLGRSLLPIIAVKDDPRLQSVTDMSPVIRDIWLLSHADDPKRGAVDAFKTWLASQNWH